MFVGVAVICWLFVGYLLLVLLSVSDCWSLIGSMSAVLSAMRQFGFAWLTLSIWGVWATKLINVGPMSDALDHEPKTYGLDQFWTYDPRTWTVLDIWAWTLYILKPWVTNLTKVGPMSGGLDRSWFKERITWLRVRPISDELDQCWNYEQRTSSV